jgi:pyrroline-5-carboxylate reductase
VSSHASATTEKVALLGGGKMGEALLAGIVRASGPGHVVVVEQLEDRAADLRARYGVDTPTAGEAAAWADTVVVAVKPHAVAGVLDHISAHLAPTTVVVSIAAGLSTSFLAEHLPQGQPVVRVMPNTPASVGAGMSVLSAGASATDVHLDRAERLLAPVGRVLRVPEDQQDAVTAVSGSGPAYFFLLVEAMAAAGEALGLDHEVATALAAQTAYGAGAMLHESPDDPAVLRANVTSPGGTTAAAIASFEDQGLRAAVQAAMTACRDRSVEMGRELERPDAAGPDPSRST